MADYQIKVRHAGKFYIEMEGKEAVCEYFFKDDNTIVFPHTFVPEELRGRGLAGKLVKKALEFARTHNLKVIPVCSYVKRYLEKHPEYKDLLA